MGYRSLVRKSVTSRLCLLVAGLFVTLVAASPAQTVTGLPSSTVPSAKNLPNSTSTVPETSTVPGTSSARPAPRARTAAAVTGPEAAYTEIVKSDFPTAYWPMNDQDSTIRDVVGTNNGSIAGGVSPSNAGPFGTNSFVQLFDGDSIRRNGNSLCTGVSFQPAPLKLPGNLTVEAWVRTSDPNGVVFRWRFYGYLLAIFDGRPIFETNNGSTFANSTRLIATGNTRVDDGEWHHLVGTKQIETNADQTVSTVTNRIFVDGELSGVTTTSVAPAQAVTTFDFDPDPAAAGRDGSACDSRLSSLTGYISHLAIYSSALVANRVFVHATDPLSAGLNRIQTKVLNRASGRCLLGTNPTASLGSCSDPLSNWTLEATGSYFKMRLPDGRCLQSTGFATSSNRPCDEFFTLQTIDGLRVIQWGKNGSIDRQTPCLSAATVALSVDTSCRNKALSSWEMSAPVDSRLGDSIGAYPETGLVLAYEFRKDGNGNVVFKDGAPDVVHVEGCTGVTIGYTAIVATAGHCFLSIFGGVKADEVRFFPGFSVVNDTIVLPYGVYRATEFVGQNSLSVQGPTFARDFAFLKVEPVKVDQLIISNLGNVSVSRAPQVPAVELPNYNASFNQRGASRPLAGISMGYPKNLGNNRDQLRCSFPRRGDRDNFPCLMTGGASGGPVLANGSVVGINMKSNGNGTSLTAFTFTFDELNDFLELLKG
jgi:hypothetical protein